MSFWKYLVFSLPFIVITKFGHNITEHSCIINEFCWGLILFQICCTKLPKGQKNSLWNNCLCHVGNIISFRGDFIWNCRPPRTLQMYNQHIYVNKEEVWVKFFTLVNSILSKDHLLLSHLKFPSACSTSM